MYGNTDTPGDPRLKSTIVREIGGVVIQVQHGHESGRLTADALLERFTMQMSSSTATRTGSWLRAGRVGSSSTRARRVRAASILMPSVARLTIRDGEAEVEIVALPV